MSLNNLYENYPQLREEWDGDIEEMKKYACFSNKKVRWICKSGNPCHKWVDSVGHRTNRNDPRGCPYCSNQRTCPCDVCPNLYNRYPELREEWDGDIEDMRKSACGSSGKKMKWKCGTKHPCHKWEAVIHSRTSGNGCPYCSGLKTCPCDICPNLYNNFPHLRDEWDGDVEDMKKTSCGSSRKVNWKCKSGNNCHKWGATTSDRTREDKTDCPYCSGRKTCPCENCRNLYNNYPHLREEWDGDIEDMKKTPCSSNKKVNWKCKSGNPCHKWKSTILNRTYAENGCPYCSHMKTCPCKNCPNLYNNFPQLRDEWDDDMEKMKQTACGSAEKAKWKCRMNNHCHKWITSIRNRTNKDNCTGCPYCSMPSRKTCPCNTCVNLYNLFPQLREEWDSDIEEMKRYAWASNEKANWKHKFRNGYHRWIDTINHRTNADDPRGCPLCKNKTEAMLFEHLSSLNYIIEREKNYPWLEDRRRFDFVINNKTIIELDGAQHFIQVSNWQDPESTQDNDIDKMNKALENGLNVIRIHQEDVYYDRIDWRNEIKEAVEYMEDKTSELKFINEVHYEHFQVQED
jgi:very-short-patch-repair endonuclease